MGIRDEAKLCFQKGKFGAAAEAYTEAITQEPGNAALYQNRALCYQKLSKWTNVVEDAGKALELAGDSVKAHYLLANAHLNLEHLDEAEASFQVACVSCAGRRAAAPVSWESARMPPPALTTPCTPDAIPLRRHAHANGACRRRCHWPTRQRRQDTGSAWSRGFTRCTRRGETRSWPALRAKMRKIDVSLTKCWRRRTR